MKKINFLATLFLILMLCGLSYSQTVKTVYTIGSNYTPGTCYPITPIAIQPPAAGNNYDKSR